MGASNSRSQTRSWCVYAVLLCACLSVAGLLRVPVLDRTVATVDTETVPVERTQSNDSADAETAIVTFSRIQNKRKIAEALEAKIVQHFSLTPKNATQFAKWIVHSADEHGVDEVLLTSIIATESSFRMNVVSHKGAVGPAQIMPKYWENFCAPLDLSVPRENVDCGARILSYLLELCWDESCAIQSYNMGFPRVKAGRVFPSVERYERTVEHYKDVFAINI